MKKILIALLLISFNAYALNPDGSVWEGTGTKATDATTFVTERGNQAVHQTVIRFAATPITMAGSAGNVLYGGLKIYTFQKGNIIIYGAEINSIGTAKLTCASAGSTTFTGLSSLGTVTPANDATLTGTEANVLASTAIAAATANIATVANLDLIAPLAPYNGTGTAMPLFLNFIVDLNASNAAGTCTFTGYVTITWSNLTNN